MAQNISVPDIGDFKDVEVIEVLVKPGDQINKNDPIVTIESDKSSVEIPSPAAGEIKDLKVKIGDKVSEGSVLATIENGQAASAPKEKKIVKEVQTQEKPKTNGEVNQVRQVKKVFAEPASKGDIDPVETNEWIDSLNSVIENDGSSRASYLLNKVIDQAYKSGLVLPDTRTTPYINTIPPEAEIKSPGDQNIEKKIRAYVRWNAAAMVVKANKKSPELGGHIGTFASAATLYDVGMNHFWRAKNNKFGGDLIYFQGHSAPGMYARAFLEGRLTSKQLDGFRQEVNKGGLSSYPHPWLMPKFWQFPTVSMGLGPIMAIYQARFLKYLINRGLIKDEGRKIWVFLGDGEMDEPESLGAIGLAAREKLDNLIFVVNCNLQRLDGPVRGNSKIIQELEGSFRGSGWNVIKVIWGSYWDQLLAKDKTGLLIKRMNECVDGEYQAFKAKGGSYVREKFFGKYPELTELVSSLTDKDIWRLNRGGHDPHKVYAAYAAAMQHTGSPTVILAKTIKGYGMGKTGESVNTTHQQKKLDEEDLIYYRDRFNVPLTDKQVKDKHINEVPDTLDEKIWSEIKDKIKTDSENKFHYEIENTLRSVGTRLSHHIYKKFGNNKLDENTINIKLEGSAGQSLGAFLTKGIKLIVEGDCNDYVGKGLSGGTIVVYPSPKSTLVSNENTIIGNTVLYGATSGKLFASGQAGERFAVRNSGSFSIVEGCGAHGCEYMTGGTAIILGEVGDNFGAGMTGGMAFVYDNNNTFENFVNPTSIIWQEVETDYWKKFLRESLNTFVKETNSKIAQKILNDFENELKQFKQICPIEMLDKLDNPISLRSHTKKVG